MTAAPADASGREQQPRHRTARDISVVGKLDLGGFNAAVDVHGRYAYVSSFGNYPPPPPPGATPTGDPLRFCPSKGVRVVDLTNPKKPRKVATFADGASEPEVAHTWNETVSVRHVHTHWFHGDLAVVPFFSCGGPGTFEGFGLYDVTNPRKPRRLALVRIDNAVFGSQVLTLSVQHGRPYVYSTSSFYEVASSPHAVFGTDPSTWTTPGTPDLQIFDVSRPKAPKKVGQWGAWAKLGIKPIRDEQGVRRAGFVHTVRVERDIAYLSYFDNGTVMLDVRNPAAPRYLGRTHFESDEAGNAVFSASARGGRILVETDENFPAENLFSPYMSGPSEWAWGHTRIYDVSDKTHPRRLANLELPSTRAQPPGTDGPFYTPHWPTVRGNQLLLSYHAEGLVVADISHPAAPKVTYQWKSPRVADPYGFFSAGTPIRYLWGLDLYRQYVVTADLSGGLYVLNVPWR